MVCHLVIYLSKRGKVWGARETEDVGMLVEWWLGFLDVCCVR